MRRPRRSSGSTVGDVLGVVGSFLAIGLLAAGVGYGLGLYLTRTVATVDGGGPGAGEPAGAPEPDREAPVQIPEPVEPAAGPAVVRVSSPTVHVYVLQLGAFSTRARAERFAQEVAAAGWDAAAVDVNGYRVWAGLFPAREDARPLAEQLREADLEVFVNERVLQARGTLPDDGREAQALAERIGTVPVLVGRAAALWDADVDAPDAAAAAAELEGRLADGLATLREGRPDPELADLHRRAVDFYSTFRDLVERSRTRLGEEGERLPPPLLADYAVLAAGAESLVASLR